MGPETSHSCDAVQQQKFFYNMQKKKKKWTVCVCTWRSMSPGSILPSAATAPPFMMEPM